MGFPSFYSIFISTVGVDGTRVCLWRFSFLALWVVVVVDIPQFPVKGAGLETHYKTSGFGRSAALKKREWTSTPSMKGVWVVRAFFTLSTGNSLISLVISCGHFRERKFSPKFSDRSFWKPLKVVDVRAFGSWMSAPKCLFFFQDFDRPDRSFGPGYPREWPPDVRGMSVPKTSSLGWFFVLDT